MEVGRGVRSPADELGMSQDRLRPEQDEASPTCGFSRLRRFGVFRRRYENHNRIAVDTSGPASACAATTRATLTCVLTRKKETMNTRKNLLFPLFLLLLIANFGCSVFMAAKQPGAKDVDLFKVGTPRSMLLAEFGLPIVSEVREGKKFEIFRFVHGYSAGAKAGRAVFHGAADVLTLGLWEVIGTPTEGVFSGDEVAYEVRYDDSERIDQVIALKKE